MKDDACRQHYASASELYKAGKLAAAVAEYEAAYKEVQIPVFLYNLGRLHQRLGNLDEAAAHFRRYLAAGVDEDPAQRQRAQEFLNQVQEQQPQQVGGSAPVPATAAASEPGGAAAPVTGQSPAQAPAEKKPVYKTWWFWTATVGGAAVIGTAIGLGVGLGTHHDTVPADIMGFKPVF